MVFKTDKAQKTFALGRKFFKSLKGGEVVLLEGALGSGKTTFVKGVLAAAGHKGRVLSPTFTLARQYQTKKFLFCHVDLYRLAQDQLFGWGLEDFLYADKVITLIEWGEKIESGLDRYTKIIFTHAGADRRKIKIIGRLDFTK